MGLFEIGFQRLFRELEIFLGVRIGRIAIAEPDLPSDLNHQSVRNVRGAGGSGRCVVNRKILCDRRR